MEGLGRALGCPWPAKINGRTWLAEPLTLWRLGTIEHHLLNQRVLPHDRIGFLLAAAHDCPGMASGLRSKADRDLKADKTLRVVSDEEMDAFLRSGDGLAFTAWLCLLHHPEFRNLETVEKEFAAMKPGDLAEFMKGRDRASGIDQLAWLDWPDDRHLIRPERQGRSYRKLQRVPWRKIFRSMYEAMLGKPDYRDLTLYELRAICCDEKELDGSMGKAPAHCPKCGVVVSGSGPCENCGASTAPATAKPTKGKRVITIGNDGKGLDELRRLQGKE